MRRGQDCYTALDPAASHSWSGGGTVTVKERCAGSRHAIPQPILTIQLLALPARIILDAPQQVPKPNTVVEILVRRDRRVRTHIVEEPYNP